MQTYCVLLNICVLCVCKNEIGEEAIDPTLADLLLDPDTPASSSAVINPQESLINPQESLINPQDSLQPSASNAPTKPAARKRRQSDFDVQCGKSMECIQDLIKAKLDKKSDDEDDVFGKMVACECRKITNSRIKRHLKKKISDLIFEAVEESETVNSASATDQVVQYILVQSDQRVVEQ